MRSDRLVTGLVLGGIGLLGVVPVFALVRALGDPAPMTRLEAIADVSTGVVTPLLLAGLAWVGRRAADRATLVVAMVGAVVLVPTTLGLGLVAALLWLPALMRLEAPARRWSLRGSAALSLVVLLAAGAVLAPTIHRDPTCWTIAEDDEGHRTYVEEPADDQYERGFAPPSLTRTEQSSGEVQEIDPESGQPVDESVPAMSETCVSDQTTPVQGLAALVLASGAVAAAWRRSLTPP